MKQWVPFIALAALMLGFGAAIAQDDTIGTDTDTTTTETDGPQTTVEILFFACENSSVMNLTGNAQPGFDVFYQVFSGSSGAGAELSALRQINADGDYTFSEQLPYANGQVVAPGSIASARILIAPEGAPEEPAFDTFVDDLQDGCGDDVIPPDVSTAPIEVTEEVQTFGIELPDGGSLGGEEVPTPEPIVVLGPRRTNENRAVDAGTIFALCDDFYPEARPGLLYDSDFIEIFWYWFADTRTRLESNLARTSYLVKINQAPIPPDQVFVSPVTPRNGVFYRFFTVPVGNLGPGFYEVEFNQDWSQQISDGFDEYGPGTANPRVRSTCNFEVQENPFGLDPFVSGLFIGADTPAHDFQRAIREDQVLDEFLDEVNGN